MDEIVIDDKKYISTKRAAKVTGYAKDYVGQLCREGRVPARLVGRSWYVLESALSDHRFGAEVATVEQPKMSKEEKRSEYPKYQADEIETIATLTAPVELAEEKPERETIKDAWEAWFDRIAKATVPTSVSEVKEEESVEERVAIEIVAPPQEPEETEEDSKPVQVHISHKRQVVAETRTKTPPVRSHTSSIIISAKIAGGVLALFFLVTFVLSTSFFDAHIISGGQDSSLAGISVYKK